MDTVQQWWGDPMAERIYVNLQTKESELPIYYSKSPQLRHRRSLVDWLSVINDNYDLCTTARQLAVTLMDYFMDNYDIEDHLLKLVAIGSLLVASKFEEKEENIPKAKSLNAYLQAPGYQLWEYLRMELTLLEFFQWRICLPTPAHFVDFILNFSVLPSDCHLNRPIQDCDRVREFVKKYNNYFLEITLQDEWYRNFKPSQIAAACVASARICLKISPHWSKHLAVGSRYTWYQLQPLVDRMLKTFTIDEEAQREKAAATAAGTGCAAETDSAGNSPCSSGGSPVRVLSSHTKSADHDSSLSDFSQAGAYFAVHHA